MINVTKTFLPPIDEYIGYIQQIWQSNQLTNNGPLVRELEDQLKQYLGVKFLNFVSNGTLALQIAIKALNLYGEVITTPFSYVATTSSIFWEGCLPVYVDIDPKTLCINPDLIVEAITARTTAILATHVYGNPCSIERIREIANEFDIPVIYDAAHAFGVNYKNRSVMSYGDISTMSFHSTKLFHTIEGGAVITNDHDIAHKISYLRNFGHRGTEEFWGIGINGKNSEFHAAMGLCVLPQVSDLIRKRREASILYDTYLDHKKINKPIRQDDTLYNYAYYPVLFPTEDHLLSVKYELNNNEIYPRRYFFPPLNKLPYTKNVSMPVAENVASKVLCLPLYDSIEPEIVERISSIINNSLAV